MIFRRIALNIIFLTALPLKVKGSVSEEEQARSIIWSPLTGLIIGAILAGAFSVLAQFLPIRVAALLTVLLYCLLTGCLHLDGLADTADGLFSGPKRKDQILEIMHDSRIGTMGVVALILVILAKVELIAALPAAVRTSAFILAAITSRFTAVMALYLMSHAREGEGMAKPYTEHLRFRDMFASLLIYSATLLFVHLPQLVLIYSSAFLFAALLLFYFKRRLQGITGDLLGALTECVEAVIFAAIFIVTTV